jgi:hypothetical protein
VDRLDLRDLVVGETGDSVWSREAMGSVSTVRDWRLGSSKLAVSMLEDREGCGPPSLVSRTLYCPVSSARALDQPIQS